ncbi:MAG: sulfite exporter TauE/SafE family protein [Saprospiraceae bacterium]
MTLIIAYILAILMGFILGLLGAGGAILTIPILVYLVGMNPMDAITSSLFVVCLTSLSAGLNYIRIKKINARAIFLFGIPSVITIWCTRRYLLPLIPDPVLKTDTILIEKSTFLLVLFALLIFTSAFKMIQASSSAILPNNQKKSIAPFILNGLLLGVITGLLGAGGGFLIVPALVLILNLDFKTADGTSLLIIAINTGVGLLSDFKLLQHLDWNFIFIFTGIAILSSFIGAAVSGSVSSSKLKPVFGYFLLIVASYILIKELIF